MHQKNEKWAFATFSSGALWGPARRRIRTQANEMNSFDSVIVADEKWMQSNSKEFVSLYNFFKLYPKGYGYWIWKPLLIEAVFNSFPDYTGVVYADSGCELNILGRERLNEYFKISKLNGVLSFELSGLESDFTHPKLFGDLGFKIIHTQRQVMATTFVIRNEPNTRKFLLDWFQLMSKENFKYLLGEDGPLKDPDPIEFPNYRAHRHDQSIFSNLVNLYGFSKIREESEWYPEWVTKGKVFPIWAARNRLRISVSANKYKTFAYLVFRKFSSLLTFKKYFF
jgi:hypothetical protein